MIDKIILAHSKVLKRLLLREKQQSFMQWRCNVADYGGIGGGVSLRDALNELYPMTGLGEYGAGYPPTMFPPAGGADRPTGPVPLPQQRPPVPGYPPPQMGLPPRPPVPGYPPPDEGLLTRPPLPGPQVQPPGLSRPPLPGAPVPQPGLSRPPLPQTGGIPPELMSYAARLGLV